MRLKYRHRQLKANALSTSCNKNLLGTIAIKQIFSMCQMIYNLEFKDPIEFGSRDTDLKNSEHECYTDLNK